MTDDLFAKLGQQSTRPRKSTDRTQELQTGAALTATARKSLRAGQYIRRQFTFRPGQLDDIATLARRLKVPQADLVRWLVDRGLQAIQRDGETPESIEVSTTRLAPPG